jgi:hypothetical protein
MVSFDVCVVTWAGIRNEDPPQAAKGSMANLACKQQFDTGFQSVPVAAALTHWHGRPGTSFEVYV